MKKAGLFLILLLVMSVTTHAGFYLEAENTNLAMGQETTIGIYGSPDESAELYLIVEWGYQSILKDPVVYSPVGSLGEVIPYTESGWTNSGYQIIVADTAVLPGGLIADFTFVTMDVGDIVVSLYNETLGHEAPKDSLTLTESPEPTTVVLLGLGGLMSRKRRG